MNRMTWPWLSVTSLSTALRRSSNSPRNLAPATSAPMSREMTRVFFRISGTSPFTCNGEELSESLGNSSQTLLGLNAPQIPCVGG